MAAVGSSVAIEIRRVNSLGHAVSSSTTFTVPPPAEPHAPPAVQVESYADDSPPPAATASVPTPAPAAAADPPASPPAPPAATPAAANLDVQKA